MSPAKHSSWGAEEDQRHPSQLGYKKEQAKAKRAPAEVTGKLGPKALLPTPLPPPPAASTLHSSRAFSGAKAGGRAAPGASDRGGECVYERGLLWVCCPWCVLLARLLLPWAPPFSPNAPPELHAPLQPEFPPLLRDLLMLAGSPGGGKSHYYLSRPRPPRKLPAPPPPRLVNGAPAPSHPVTGTRRHKERSKQGARCSLPGPFIKPRPRGKRRQPPTRRRAGSSRTL